MSAAVHFTSSQYFKQVKDFAEFYKSSLLYLAFISSDALPPDQKLVGCPVSRSGVQGSARRWHA